MISADTASGILIDLTDTHRSLVVALVQALPPDDRLEIVATEMAGRDMAITRGRAVSVPLWLHELRHLDRLGLIDLVQVSQHGWGITPLPLSDRVAELIRERQGQPSVERLAILRGERLDRRYTTFGRRMANLLALIPLMVWGIASAIIGSAVSIVPGIPIALAVAALAWFALMGVLGRSAMEMARSVRDPVAGILVRVGRLIVEGRQA